MLERMHWKSVRGRFNCLFILLFLNVNYVEAIGFEGKKQSTEITILEELQEAPLWFIDYGRLNPAKQNEYFKFNKVSLGIVFENYLLWKNEKCYWRIVFDEANYSIRKNSRQELVIIHNLGGDDYRELRFVKEGDFIVYTLGEYLNGELALPTSSSIMRKVKDKPLNYCVK